MHSNGIRLVPARHGIAWVLMTLAVLTEGGCASTLPERFRAHVAYLSSDTLEGRGVGSPGLTLAAEYIAEQFEIVGLRPGGDDGSYFQTFEMTLHREMTDEGRLAFEAGRVGDLTQKRDFVPFAFSSNDEFSGDVVFCGYGIDAPEREHRDFAHRDLSGKVALMLRGEPDSWADEDGYPTPHASFRNKVYNARDRGAVAVLLVNPKRHEGEQDTLTPFDRDGAAQYGIPAFHVTREVVGRALTHGGMESLGVLQNRLDAGGYASGVLSGVRARGLAGLKETCSPTSNVAGILEGEGARADEFVIIGAHYDHLGIRRPMLRKFKGGRLQTEDVEPQIHNGADDNASGVSGLIEVARLFSHARRPGRSIVFVAFTAEETGLQGSRYYVGHPCVPVDRTVAMLNMDMIGRLNPVSNAIRVFGADTGEELAGILRAAGPLTGLGIETPFSTAGGGDHVSFVHAGVPAMHFFTGYHSDYHKPSDDSDKINTMGGAKVVKLVYEVARQIADRDGKLTFQEPNGREGSSDEMPTYRVVMGLTPDIGGDDKPGMLVEAVNPEGPADLAGMRAKDRILRIGDKKIANIFDYMAALRKNNPGDAVEVTVLRDGEEIPLSVTLSGAG
jgi:aminopeptidase YwaD